MSLAVVLPMNVGKVHTYSSSVLAQFLDEGVTHKPIYDHMEFCGQELN